MIDLGARQGTECNRMPTWFKIEASNDDTNWDLILERQYLSQWYHGETRQFWVNNSTKYKYYRLSSIEQPTAYFSLSRFRLFKKIEGQIPTVGFVPQMSSISQGGYIASGSSVSGSSRSPHHAFDNDTGTAWVSAENSDVTTHWIQIKFPTATICDAIWMRSRNDEYYIQAPTSFEILGSNDGENFITIKTFSNLSWTQAEQKILEFQNANEYLYYRVHSLSVCNNGTRFALSELNFGSLQRQYKRSLNKYTYLVPTLSSNTSASGYIASASSEYSNNEGAWRAFDQQSSQWTTRNGVNRNVELKITLPEAQKCDLIMLETSDANARVPQTFRIEASNDDSNWTALYQNLEGANLSTYSNYYYENPYKDTAFKYYRLYILTNKGDGFISLREFQLIKHTVIEEY